MEKKTMITIFAVGIVAVFIIEMFAIGYLGSGAQAASSQSGTGGTMIQGTATANITINRYGPYLIVQGGNQEAVESTVGMLKGKGLVAYTTKSADGLIVSLNKSRDAVAAAEEFEKANASVLATAYIGMQQEVEVAGDGVTTTAEGITFNTQIRPLYEEGSTQEAQMDIGVQDGKIVGLGSFSILPRVVMNASATAAFTAAPKSAYVVEVPWDSRVKAKGIAAAANATYKEKSYILISQSTPTQALSSAGRLQFATGAQQGVISVQNGFTDIGTAVVSLGMLNISSPTFPPSLATFPNDAGNASAIELLAKLAEANITATISQTSKATVALPEIITKDGNNYRTGNAEFSMDGTGFAANATAVDLYVDFTAEGSRLTRVLAARPA